jgi:hypothetical protein
MPKIVITVEGGNIQDVTADDISDLEVLIMDFDIESDDADAKTIMSFAEGIEISNEILCNSYLYEVNEHKEFVDHFFNENSREDNTISEERKKKYIEDPSVCPYCGHKEINVIDENSDVKVIQCETCYKKWGEEYKLLDIFEIQ